MRIVLQSSVSSMYLRQDATWTEQIHEALHFDNSTQAERHCRASRLGNVHILVKFDSQMISEIRLHVRTGKGARSKGDFVHS